jgi:hypothetical protein
MFFPLWTSNLRKVQELGLTSLCNNNREFRGFVECLTSLALILLSTIYQVWASIIDKNFGRFERIDRLLDYIQRTWIASERPLFSREVWSHFGDIRCLK